MNGPKSREETPKEGDAIRAGAHTALRQYCSAMHKIQRASRAKAKARLTQAGNGASLWRAVVGAGYTASRARSAFSCAISVRYNDGRCRHDSRVRGATPHPALKLIRCGDGVHGGRKACGAAPPYYEATARALGAYTPGGITCHLGAGRAQGDHVSQFHGDNLARFTSTRSNSLPRLHPDSLAAERHSALRQPLLRRRRDGAAS